MNRIADMRNPLCTIEDAKRVMGEIARLTCEIAVEGARLDKAVTAARTKFEERTMETAASLKKEATRLAGFIMAKPDLFRSPRKIKTEHGTFGRQQVSELVITDEDALITAIMDYGYEDCLKVVRTPIKDDIKTRIEDKGEVFPGCHIKTGDTAVYKVAKSFVTAEVEKALQ